MTGGPGVFLTTDTTGLFEEKSQFPETETEPDAEPTGFTGTYPPIGMPIAAGVPGKGSIPFFNSDGTMTGAAALLGISTATGALSLGNGALTLGANGDITAFNGIAALFGATIIGGELNLALAGALQLPAELVTNPFGAWINMVEGTGGPSTLTFNVGTSDPANWESNFFQINGQGIVDLINHEISANQNSPATILTNIGEGAIGGLLGGFLGGGELETLPLIEGGAVTSGSKLLAKTPSTVTTSDTVIPAQTGYFLTSNSYGFMAQDPALQLTTPTPVVTQATVGSVTTTTQAAAVLSVGQGVTVTGVSAVATQSGSTTTVANTGAVLSVGSSILLTDAVTSTTGGTTTTTTPASFVVNGTYNGPIAYLPTSKSTSYTILTTDSCLVVTTSGITLTLPSTNTVGWTVKVANTSSGTITIANGSHALYIGGTSYTTSYTLAAYCEMEFVCTATTPTYAGSLASSSGVGSFTTLASTGATSLATSSGTVTTGGAMTVNGLLTGTAGGTFSSSLTSTGTLSSTGTTTLATGGGSVTTGGALTVTGATSTAGLTNSGAYNGPLKLGFITTSSSLAIVTTDTFIVVTSSGVTLTMPSVNTVGWVVKVANTSSGTITIANGSNSIYIGGSSYSGSYTMAAYNEVEFVCTATTPTYAGSGTTVTSSGTGSFSTLTSTGSTTLATSTGSVTTRNTTLDDGSGSMVVGAQLTCSNILMKWDGTNGTQLYDTHNGGGWLRQIGAVAGNVSTNNNILDDGSGNVTINGVINVANAQIKYDGTNGIQVRDQLHGGGWLHQPGAVSGAVATNFNSLDDGSGNMVVLGSISANSSNTNFHIAPKSSGSVGFTNQAQSNWGLQVTDGSSPGAYTLHNTLDDGSGNMTVTGKLNLNHGSFSWSYTTTTSFPTQPGNAPVQQSITFSSTAPSTPLVFATPINQSSSTATWAVSVSTVSTTGCTLNFVRIDVASVESPSPTVYAWAPGGWGSTNTCNVWAMCP